MSRILVIDDEPQIRRFLRISLSSQGYEILEAETGEDGLAKASLENPQLIILDLGLPDIDGKEVLKTLREFYESPVIVLSVRYQEAEKVATLDAGAIYDDGRLYVNLLNRRVILAGEEIRLSRKEFELLKILMSHAGRIVTQQQLLREIWGPTHRDDSHYLRIFIAKIRTKLSDDPANPRYIETEPGVGYRFRQVEG